jgi:hypothetical protein
MTGPERDLSSALDRLVPPPLSPDFAARVMAAAEQRRAPRFEPPARRNATRLWARRGRIGFAVAVTGLVGAAAAATGLMGERVRNLPVISFVSTEIVGRPAPAPKPQPVLARRTEPKTASVEQAAPEQVAKPLPPRAEKRLDRINARREAKGLPPVDRARVAEARAKWRALPQEDRRAIREAMRERRAARQADELPRERLTPEQRERLKEWRALRRGQSAPSEPVE